MRRIIAAAVCRNGEIVKGLRHYYCIRRAVLEHGWKIPITMEEQGFIDNSGIFLSREEAKEIAITSGQLPNTYQGILISEDLF